MTRSGFKSQDFGMRTYVDFKKSTVLDGCRRYLIRTIGRPTSREFRNRMEYKGYIAQFIYDEDRELFEGQVANITDIILFHGKSIESLRFAFKDAINDYLSWCKRIGKEPEKPSSLPDSNCKP